MITHFRQLRQKLVASGSITKYLLYAVGEIMLVVIGILLALQINNWNEVRKSQLEEARIVSDLNEEFQENLNELEIDISRLELHLSSVDSIMALMLQPELTYSLESFEKIIANTLGQPTWNPSFFVIEDLKNAGGLGRLNNQRLKNALFNWEREYSNLLEVQLSFVLSSNYYVNYLRQVSSLRDIDSYDSGTDIQRSILLNRNLNLLKDYQFENNLDDLFIISTRILEEYNDARAKIQEILDISSLE